MSPTPSFSKTTDLIICDNSSSSFVVAGAASTLGITVMSASNQNGGLPDLNRTTGARARVTHKTK
jgi:hypothetical protein